MLFKNILFQFAVPLRTSTYKPPANILDSELKKGIPYGSGSPYVETPVTDIARWRHGLLDQIRIYLIGNSASQARLKGAINSIVAKLSQPAGTRPNQYVLTL
jgi:hypothetical protein